MQLYCTFRGLGRKRRVQWAGNFTTFDSIFNLQFYKFYLSNADLISFYLHFFLIKRFLYIFRHVPKFQSSLVKSEIKVTNLPTDVGWKWKFRRSDRTHQSWASLSHSSYMNHHSPKCFISNWQSRDEETKNRFIYFVSDFNIGRFVNVTRTRRMLARLPPRN